MNNLIESNEVVIWIICINNNLCHFIVSCVCIWIAISCWACIFSAFVVTYPECSGWCQVKVSTWIKHNIKPACYWTIIVNILYSVCVHSKCISCQISQIWWQTDVCESLVTCIAHKECTIFNIKSAFCSIIFRNNKCSS